MTNDFPTPETVSILADIAEEATDLVSRRGLSAGVAGSAHVIQSLARFAGAGTDPNRRPTAEDERTALVRLASHAVARIQALDTGGDF